MVGDSQSEGEGEKEGGEINLCLVPIRIPCTLPKKNPACIYPLSPDNFFPSCVVISSTIER
jgi:hypothetical protein